MNWLRKIAVFSIVLGSVSVCHAMPQVAISSSDTIVGSSVTATDPTSPNLEIDHQVGQLVNWQAAAAEAGSQPVVESWQTADSTQQVIEQGSCLDHFLPRTRLPFPLMKQLVEGRDVTLPLPLGTGFIWTELDRKVAVGDVRLGLGNNTPTSVDRVSVPTTKMRASSKLARVDLWVLPFLNLYGIVGHTESTGDVAVTVERFPFPFSPPATINVPVNLQGTTAGWGMTTGIGTKKWFAMLDLNKTWTDFDRVNSSLTALVITPRVGLVVDRPLIKGEIHIGAMWQDTAQTVDLTIDHPALGNGLHVQVDQFEPSQWNFLVGGLWAIDERLQFLVEGGTGARIYISSGVTVRY